MLKNFFLLLFLSSIAFSQLKDKGIQSINELRTVVENASRANQKVWLEDFTGIN